MGLTALYISSETIVMNLIDDTASSQLLFFDMVYAINHQYFTIGLTIYSNVLAAVLFKLDQEF